MQPTYLGNKDLLQQKKMAFFCSRDYSAQSVLRSYDWATEQEKSTCIVSTFRSPIEKDVLHFLLKKGQPIIMVLGRRMYRKIPTELQQALDEGRLLLISLCPETMIRTDVRNYAQANKYILSIVTEVTFGYLSEKSSLWPLYEEAKNAHYIEKLTVL